MVVTPYEFRVLIGIKFEETLLRYDVTFKDERAWLVRIFRPNVTKWITKLNII